MARVRTLGKVLTKSVLQLYWRRKGGRTLRAWYIASTRLRAERAAAQNQEAMSAAEEAARAQLLVHAQPRSGHLHKAVREE